MTLTEGTQCLAFQFYAAAVKQVTVPVVVANQ
jgi:hypothetical protein